MCRFLTQTELHQNETKHKQLPPQFHFAKLSGDNQIKPVHHLVQHLTVLPSKKDDCLPILVDFGKDQFSNRNKDERKRITIKSLA